MQITSGGRSLGLGARGPSSTRPRAERLHAGIRRAGADIQFAVAAGLRRSVVLSSSDDRPPDGRTIPERRPPLGPSRSPPCALGAANDGTRLACDCLPPDKRVEARHGYDRWISGMDDLAVLTPSFRGDVGLFADLHDSVLANTARSVVHHVVVPPSDAHLFREYEGTRCRVWTHRDLLPRYCVSVPHASGLTLSLRRPWPPIRGWVTQQIMKIAGTAAMDARAVLIIDSDAVLLREPTLDQFTHNGRLRHFRNDRAVTAGMDRHLLWHNVARKLLGAFGHRVAARTRLHQPDHRLGSQRRPLPDGAHRRPHRTELDGRGRGRAARVRVRDLRRLRRRRPRWVTPFSGPLCHNYYERIPLSPADARAFADQMPSNALGAMISSHSRTPHDVRREAFRRCAEIAEGSSPKRALDPPAQPAAGRILGLSAAWTLRCCSPSCPRSRPPV